MTISVGDKLPEATFKTMTADGPANITTGEVFSGKKVVLFAVPGAFTPTCNNNHLPGFLENFDAITGRGVDTIAVVATNDVFVMNAWAQATGGKDRLLFLSDGNADFAKAIGMDVDLGAAGMGTRTKRYSMIVDDGTVSAFNIEQARGEVVDSGAARILEQL